MTEKITLIIPDLHLRWRDADAIISKVKHDEVIFLGDYFDDFGDTPEMIQDTCDWLAASVKKPNRIHLFGNHDVHYAYTYRGFKCSGYDQWKYFLIHDCLPRETWDSLKWYHNLDDQWLLSHGGLHKAYVPKDLLPLANDRVAYIKAIGEYLDQEIINGFRAIGNNVPHWIFGSGRSRGGINGAGGLIWCDFEREFYPVAGLHQIVGHTPQGLGFPKWCRLNKGHVSMSPYDNYTPKEKDLNSPDSSVNINLDVWKNTHYGVWDGKKLTVGNYNSL